MRAVIGHDRATGKPVELNIDVNKHGGCPRIVLVGTRHQALAFMAQRLANIPPHILICVDGTLKQEYWHIRELSESTSCAEALPVFFVVPNQEVLRSYLKVIYPSALIHISEPVKYHVEMLGSREGQFGYLR